jgi:hypothetical protein
MPDPGADLCTTTSPARASAEQHRETGGHGGHAQRPRAVGGGTTDAGNPAFLCRAGEASSGRSNEAKCGTLEETSVIWVLVVPETFLPVSGLATSCCFLVLATAFLAMLASQAEVVSVSPGGPASRRGHGAAWPRPAAGRSHRLWSPGSRTPTRSGPPVGVSPLAAIRQVLPPSPPFPSRVLPFARVAFTGAVASGPGVAA